MPQPIEVIRSVETETLRIPLIGTAELIVSRFSEKAQQEILDKQQGRAKPKQIRDPKAEYERAFYRTATGYGLPSVSFKSAIVSTADFYGKELTMAGLRRRIFVDGIRTAEEPQKLVEITGEPYMRQDMVRLSGVGRTPDLRFRPGFPEWSTVIEVTYVKSALSRTTMYSLIEAGGTFIGVGEWRPENSGDFGTFTIDPEKQVEVVVNERSEN